MPEIEREHVRTQQASSSQSRHRLIASWVCSILAAIVTVAVGALLGGKSYIIVSVLMVIYCMVPFFFTFEQRRPDVRELVILAVLCALAVASRAAFVWLPFFKPMAAVVMIAGIACGASSGFMVGSLSVLASNFIFGQGPWTPWQMLSFGLCGFVFGLLADRGLIRRSDWSVKMRCAISICGGIFYVLVAGPILDTSSVFFMLSTITPASVIAIYAAGFPVNCIQGAATLVTLLVVANPILGMLRRVQEKM